MAAVRKASRDVAHYTSNLVSAEGFFAYGLCAPPLYPPFSFVFFFTVVMVWNFASTYLIT